MIEFLFTPLIAKRHHLLPWEVCLACAGKFESRRVLYCVALHYMHIKITNSVTSLRSWASDRTCLLCE